MQIEDPYEKMENLASSDNLEKNKESFEMRVGEFLINLHVRTEDENLEVLSDINENAKKLIQKSKQ